MDVSETSGPVDPPNPEAAEDFAEDVGVDPTPDEVEHYRRLEGDDPLGDDPASTHPPSGEDAGRDPEESRPA